MEMPAPTAAAAKATGTIELEKRSRMVVSFLHCGVLLQRIPFNAHKIRGGVFCGRIRTSALRKGELFHPRSTHLPRKTIVSFDAARLVVDSVFLVALLGELLL